MRTSFFDNKKIITQQTEKSEQKKSADVSKDIAQHQVKKSDALLMKERTEDVAPNRKIAAIPSKPVQIKIDDQQQNIDNPPKRYELSINESDVIAMESTLNELKDQINISREQRGWRIRSINSESDFSRLGFQPGMLVLQEHVDALFRNGEGQNLVSRMTYILDSLVK